MMKSLKPFEDADTWSTIMTIIWAAVMGSGSALIFLRRFIGNMTGGNRQFKALQAELADAKQTIKERDERIDSLEERLIEVLQPAIQPARKPRKPRPAPEPEPGNETNERLDG